jgi:hypothetical protein
MADRIDCMEFIETPTFTRMVVQLMTDEPVAILRELVKEL